MIKIKRVDKKNTPIFRTLFLKLLENGFEYYAKKANAYNSKFWSHKRIREFISTSNHLIVIAFKDSLPVGYLVGKSYEDARSSILWMGVVAPFRGQGIGEKLIEYFEIWAKRRGVKIIRASTANFDNEKFYLKEGFKKLAKTTRNDWGMKKLVFIKRVKTR